MALPQLVERPGRHAWRPWALAMAAAVALSACGNSHPPATAPRPQPVTTVAADVVKPDVVRPDGWVGAWAAAPYGPYPLGPLTSLFPVDAALPLPSYLPNDHAVDQSFRMIVHPTIGGTSLRVRLSNLMGDRPVTFDPVHIGRSLTLAGPALVPGTDMALSFGGELGVTVAPGAEAISDPVPMVLSAGDDLAITFHVVGESGAITWHAVAFGPNYVGLPNAGDQTGDVTGVGFPQPSLGWFFISGVDVRNPNATGAIVAIGDSITDGAYTAANTRWTDWFTQRLQATGMVVGMLNEGINSNTVTVAASPPGSEYEGPPAVLRFDRDVLQRSGVHAVVIFEGTNDLSAGASAANVFTGIRSMVTQAHAAGLCVVVGTIMPRGDTPIAPWTAANEVQRKQLNAMLRAQTDIEGLADFDTAMANPLAPDQPNLPLYFPDQLHPNSVGTKVMANVVPIGPLMPSPTGHCAAAPQP